MTQPTTVAHLQNFVGGAFVDGGGERITVRSSATGEPVATVEDGDRTLVKEAVAVASGAFRAWRRTTPRERAQALLDLADSIDSDTAELARLESRNTGRTVAAAEAEVAHAADAFRFFAGAARNLEGKAAGEYLPDKTSFIRRDPLGVCGQITPWNYPFMMAALAVAPALAGGNTTVLKPSELTPVTSLRLAELSCGILPDGVFNVVTGRGETAGDALVRDPDISLVSLIGDVGTGKTITRNSADTLKRLHLELGGKAPVIVYGDADLQLLTETMKVASFWNAGQDCTAATRILVDRRIHDNFVADFVDAIDSLVVGEPDVPNVQMGPVISEQQRERVLGFVDRAREDGAEIALGGTKLGERGYFVKPTIVVNPDQRSEIVQREVFGPVVTVQAFSDEDRAVEWANGVPYGLASSVWSRSAGRLFRTARDLQFGTVWLNDHFPMANEMPHGGFKQSGHGKDQSMYSLEDYTTVKHVMLNLSSR